jgi:hypothetical protein
MKTILASALTQTYVLYGASGVGKTKLLATAPKPAILDSNQGLLTIAGRPEYAHVHGESITTMADLDRAYDNFTGTGKRDWSKKYLTIGFDHFDDIQALVLDELGEKRKSRDDRADPDEIDQRTWGVMGSRLKRYVRKFKSVPIHKVLICGESEDRENGRMRPSLQGQLKTALPYLVDHIMYLREGKKGVRYLHLTSGDEFIAKTRASWLTPEQRKWRVDEDNHTFLTDLFALIAAGPSSRRPTTNG